MRVLVSHEGGSERGAVSVLVVALLVTFVGLAAFAADIGLGYAEKRQQSIAADASTLASARAVNDALPPGTACNAGTLEGLTSVQSSASTINSANDLDGRSSLSQPVAVNCNPAGVNGIEVTVRNSEPVPTTFLNSQLLGIGTLEPPGAAVSLLFVPDTGPLTGLRPVAACESTLVNAIDDDEPFLVELNKTTGACDTTNSGKWGYVNFLDQGQFGGIDDSSSLAYFDDPCAGGSETSGGNAGCQGSWLRDGYQGPFYFPIPYSSGDTGLLGNTGQVKSTNSDLAGIVGQEILLPVATGFVEGSGNNGRLNITGVMAAYVCAANLPPGPSSGITVETNSDPRCATYPLPTSTGADLLPTSDTTGKQPPGYFTDRWTTMDSKEALLWVVPSQFLTTGAPLNPSTGCTIGDPNCDFGVRGVQLWK